MVHSQHTRLSVGRVDHKLRFLRSNGTKSIVTVFCHQSTSPFFGHSGAYPGVVYRPDCDPCHALQRSYGRSAIREPIGRALNCIQRRDGPFLEIGRFESSFFTLPRKAVLRSVGRPCFFNKSLKASSASSWKSIMRSRASKSSACHVWSSNWTRLPGIYPLHLRLAKRFRAFDL